jgi:hypothetical protein
MQKIKEQVPFIKTDAIFFALKGYNYTTWLMMMRGKENMGVESYTVMFLQIMLKELA